MFSIERSVVACSYTDPALKTDVARNAIRSAAIDGLGKVIASVKLIRCSEGADVEFIPWICSD